MIVSPALAAELIRLKVDILVVGWLDSKPVTRRQLTSTIPIVMALGYAMLLQNGFIASLARPGGNITGLSTLSPARLAGKRLELLKEISAKTLTGGRALGSSTERGQRIKR